MNRRQFGQLLAIASVGAAVGADAPRARATTHPLILQVRLVYDDDRQAEARPGTLARADMQNLIETTLRDGRRLLFCYSYPLDLHNIFDPQLAYVLGRSHAIRKALGMIGEIIDGNRPAASQPDGGPPPEPWTGVWVETSGT